ncbi:MAG: glycoside hydrolase family 3 C-terminal domain-containing protein [Tannerellaceae bacterium]|jgi:beta-glucosidase|nr:glycoside hydrolase family 3 C-terminal domain-containing protein [Tannerellaceae bacterium]
MKLNIKRLISFLVIGVMGCTVFAQSSALLSYKNPSLPVEMRVQDLLSHMTIDEKIGQLLCPMGWEMYEKEGNKVTYSRKFEELIQKQHAGMLWAVYRADPWTRKTLETGLNPVLAAKTSNAIQCYAMENTRLGIPVFIAEEAPHGHMAIGTTVFPTGIGLAATWNPSLVEYIASVISKEVRLQGGHISYGPVLDLSRDPRWSRVEEGYGEDPVLSARIGASYVRGTGGGDITKPYSTIATLKHFIAYGVPEGGHNGNTAFVGERELRENFFLPFKAAIDAGALSVMTAYNSIDGIPCTANKHILTDILRDEWGFKGFVVSDLVSIDGLKENHRIVDNLQDAAIAALSAGVDIDLGANSFSELVDAVREGKIGESAIDSAVYRVLKLKFEMGLFDNPYVDPAQAGEIVRSPQHIAAAHKAAQESIVLLENKGNILPLKKNIKRIAVIGPNSDNSYNQLGDYTAPQERSYIKTVLDGVKAKMPGARIDYVKGCAIRDTTITDIDKAVYAAKNADVAIVVVGGSSARDFKTKYIETGAAVASTEAINDIENGEGFDRSTLDLLGKQLDLLKAVKATGTPVIVIYIQGRPLNMNWAAENADALLTAWYPGQEGGLAIADVLWGDYNPAGRLPVSVPRSVGQIPVYYNKKNPKGHEYIEITSKPLYHFGYGLSYTRFEYTDLNIIQKYADKFEVSFTLKNIGDYDGEEVVQLYLKDEYASVVQPVMQLKKFERIFLKKGNEKRISFTIGKEDFSIINKDMEKVVEPGEFTVMIGSAVDRIKLQDEIIIDYRQHYYQ